MEMGRQVYLVDVGQDSQPHHGVQHMNPAIMPIFFLQGNSRAVCGLLWLTPKLSYNGELTSNVPDLQFKKAHQCKARNTETRTLL